MASHVVLVGNIGAGKSTTLDALSGALGLPAVPQLYRQNPFLEAFYADPPAWAFRSQLWFTAESIEAQARIAREGGGAVQEQMLLSTHRVMTRAVHEEGHITADELATLDTLVAAVAERLPLPDLVIRLRAGPETLLNRIARRGRDFEGTIGAGYLQRIDRALDALVADWPGAVLEIDTERLDVRTDEGLAALAERARAALG